MEEGPEWREGREREEEGVLRYVTLHLDDGVR